jgi:hypothetical protein
MKKLKNNYINGSSGNKQINKFIQEMRLKIDHPNDTVFEWIPYNQFNNIKRLVKDDFVTLYPAIWKNGPLYYANDVIEKIYKRESDKEVILKYLGNSQDEIRKFLKGCPMNKYKYVYGISQDQDTKDYVLVFNNAYFEMYCANCGKIYTNKQKKWCKPCQIRNLKNNCINENGRNKQINNLIQKMRLKISDPNDIVFEWIPYNQLEKIIKNHSLTLYLAIWKNGPLYWNSKNKEYVRASDERVALRYIEGFKNFLTKV